MSLGLTWQSIYDAKLAAIGTVYACRETGETFRALGGLTPGWAGPARPEGGENTAETQGLALHAIDRDAAVDEGDNIHVANIADADANNYLVTHVDVQRADGVVVRKFLYAQQSPLKGVPAVRPPALRPDGPVPDRAPDPPPLFSAE